MRPIIHEMDDLRARTYATYDEQGRSTPPKGLTPAERTRLKELEGLEQYTHPGGSSDWDRMGDLGQIRGERREADFAASPEGQKKAALKDRIENGPNWYYFDDRSMGGMRVMSEPQETELANPKVMTDEELAAAERDDQQIYWPSNPNMLRAYNWALRDEKERRAKGGTLPTPVAASAWEDGMPIDLTVSECHQVVLRAHVKGGMTATATSAWNATKRKKAAASGAAMPGGRFPIKDCRDVEKAVHALGRAKGDTAKVKAHIRKRAKALGCMSNVPDTWKPSTDPSTLLIGA